MSGPAHQPGEPEPKSGSRPDTPDFDNEPTFRLTGAPPLPEPEPEPTESVVTPVRPPPESAEFPPIGERFLHFELVEELGRGAFARVYLARQESLANRLVVLKLTATPTDEPQKLARLQHTNVVPIYSVHDAGRLHAVCMPFLGRVTLARVFHHLAAHPELRSTSARALVELALADRAPSDGLASTHAEGPDPLARMSFAEGCLRLVSQVAAGLGHAHARGILHRDLKPGNVLLTGEGVAMILDFNVSSESARGSVQGRIGGTLPYMSPEHLRAFAGEAAAVDRRSDLYSLGVILYELLTGQHPYPIPEELAPDAMLRAMIALRVTPPPPPSQFNPAVTPAIDSIVLKLLDPDPARRYASAENLCDDLTRQLAHRPLRFAGDVSLRERVVKWRRRHPRFATGAAVAVVALLTLILPASVIAARAREVHRAEAEVMYAASAQDLRTAAVLLGSRSDPLLREQGVALARDVLGRYAVAEDLDWESRPAVARLTSEKRAALKADLGEVLILLTRAEAQRGEMSAALRWNQHASAIFPAPERPTVLDRHREELQRRQAGQPLLQFTAPHLDTARDADLYFDGLDLAGALRYAEALPLLTRFCERHPTRFLAWFARGVCHDGLGQSGDAAVAFAVCVALRPDSPYAHAERGIAWLKLRRYADAEEDFTRALELKPHWVAALLNRGLAREGLRRYADAQADFTAALAESGAPTRLYFLRSRVRRASGDITGADADRVEGLTREPSDAVSWATRGTWHMNAKQPEKALSDFDTALTLHGTYRDALWNKAIVLADHLHREADAIPVLDGLLEHHPDYVDARAARGVYLARLGRADEARRDAADSLKVDRSAHRLFQMAGLFAKLSKVDGRARDEAIRHLARALRAGFTDMNLLKTDADLDPIRDDPRFAQILAAVGQLDQLGQ